MSTVIPIIETYKSSNHSVCIPKIQEWIDTNSYFIRQDLVWNIGLTNAENLINVESIVRQDITCKHWKYWRADCFKDAMQTIRQLNRAHYVIKSDFNNYLLKGSYVFIYKTMVPRNSRLFHTLHCKL